MATSPELPSSPNQHSRRKKLVAAVSALVTLSTVGAAVAALNGSGSSKKTAKATPTTLEVPRMTTSTLPEITTLPKPKSTTSISTTSTTTTTTTPETTTLPPTTTTAEQVQPDVVDSWPIVGSPEDQADIRDSLRMSKDLPDQTYWKIVEKSGSAIVADPLEFGVFPIQNIIKMNAKEINYIGTDTSDPAQDEINKENNKKWRASSMVHDFLQDDLEKAGKKWYGASAENLALYEQAQFLIDVHGDPNQINWVNNEIDPTDSPASYWNRYFKQQIVPYQP